MNPSLPPSFLPAALEARTRARSPTEQSSALQPTGDNSQEEECFRLLWGQTSVVGNGEWLHISRNIMAYSCGTNNINTLWLYSMGLHVENNTSNQRSGRCICATKDSVVVVSCRISQGNYIDIWKVYDNSRYYWLWTVVQCSQEWE